ncbi:MAG: PolC-type DNA polymerase III [Clostridiales bacterium]|nr:PolC-type DNA polymerase III [Clostridiales bacterium]
MEKRRIRLIDFFRLPDELNSGIDGLFIEKFDFYDSIGIMRISLSGSASLSYNSDITPLLSHLSRDIGSTVEIRFIPGDVLREDLPEFIRKTVPLMKYMCDKEFHKAGINPDIFDLDMVGETLTISSDSIMSAILDEKDVRDAAFIFIKAVKRLTGINIDKYEYIKSAPVGGEASYDPVPDPEPPAADSFTYFEPEFTPEDVQAMNKAREEQEKKKKESAPAEEGVNKDSWAYKAKEVQKNQKTEDRKFKREKNSEKTIIGRVKDGIRISDIKDVMMGDGTVNVVGNITLNDDLRLAKSGKCVIANFNVIDKTGGMGCIAFIKPEEADMFEKKFKKGGWAGVQGEVQFNRDEIGIKVSGLFEAEKPKGRKDNAPQKRVELHVHSKMSEKDAVSDPSAIMKLAASFGHKACAITDHGVVQAFPEVYNTAKGLEVDGEKFKAILGCEGYLSDDGPTLVYGLPYDMEAVKHIGSFVTMRIHTTGPDHCSDLITSVTCSKFVLKGYKALKPVSEGESDEDAKEFSEVDIDTSLWDESEIPEELRDENLKQEEIPPREKVGVIYNKADKLYPDYAEDDIEYVPDSIVFEHVGDFHAEFEDMIYPGSGEPCESYFVMGELLDFIGDSYIGGRDVFNTLGFLRRAGYGINIEDHKYYRNKFLHPAISVEDIIRYGYEGEYKDEPIYSFAGTGDPAVDEDIRACLSDADVIANYLIGKNETDPTVLNSDVGHLSKEDLCNRKLTPAYHIIYLARNNLGLYDLYRIISEAHVHYFSFRPRTPKSLLKYYSSGLIIGGACEQGEIYRFVMSAYKRLDKNEEATKDFLASSQEMKDILSIYDYVEIQPLCNNMFMVRQDPAKSRTGNVPVNETDIRIVNELLVWLADCYKMPCVATCDSHFLEKEDGKYRKYILMDMDFSDADMQTDLYFRTTEEMLEEFSYLGEEKAFEVVVSNTNMIADKIEYGLKPFPDGTYPPIIARAASDVRNIAYTRANKMYRHNGVLDPTVKARLEKELKSIIGNGFAIMYYIAYRLVKKSNNDGYIVGSRGSVGSSFVATMCGISEVNPLAPHHRCPNCNYTVFNNSGEFGSGYDMPDMECPECGTKMTKDGQDIPFETFLGFFGDKQPDIDLNFSGEYQPRAHKYVEFLFGLTHTFRAGTIGTYADKNALMVARKACEKKGESYTAAKLAYMSEGIIGVKRNTSQHPGGIVVVPKEMDVYEFTPIQYPANKTDCGIITTHFDFHAMHDTILKLDILGHADPTVLRMLHEITDVDIQKIPIPDDKVMSLLHNTDALGFPIEKTDAGSATLGLSELGTHMARGMIKETQPSHFYDLVQLMGLSHGTDVWTGNAQELIKDGTCDLNSVIGCRDSIMTRLIYWGLPNKDSFDIMEKVRKGKGLTPEHEQLMVDNNVPKWYIESCKKIKYMFPKAHAAAYSISTLRVAWFKVYYPEEYYCAFFSIRGDEFDAETMCHGWDKVKLRRQELAERMRQDDNPKIKSEFYLCEIVEEMYARDITFAPIDLYDSEAVRFKKIGKGLIRPPFKAIDSISDSMAEQIVQARNSGGEFRNREEFTQRTGIGQSATQKLLDYGGIIDDLPESAQVTLFDLFGE